MSGPSDVDHLVLKEPLHPGLLSQHRSATRVSIIGARFTEQDLRALQAFPKLTSVRIVGGALDLRALRDLSNVRELALDDPHTLDGVGSLKGLT